MSITNTTLRMAGKVASAVAAAAGFPIPGAAGAATEAVLTQLLGVCEEQGENLRRIDANVQRLIDQPWRLARMHLREALLPGQSPAQVMAALNRAALSFREALTLLPARTPSAVCVTFDLAVVLALLGERSTSRQYARDCLHDATDMLNKLVWDEYLAVAGPYLDDGRRKWPDRRKLARYRPEHSALPEASLDWLSLALAVATLTDDRPFVVAERNRIRQHTLCAVELLARGAPADLAALSRINDDAERRYLLASELPVAVRSWSTSELPDLPAWWPLA